jgi:hypothetical protein
MLLGFLKETVAEVDLFGVALEASFMENDFVAACVGHLEAEDAV